MIPAWERYNHIQDAYGDPEEIQRKAVEKKVAENELHAAASLERGVAGNSAQQEAEDKVRWKDMTKGHKAGMLLDALGAGLAAAASNNPGATAASLLSEKLRARMAERQSKRDAAEAADQKAHEVKLAKMGIKERRIENRKGRRHDRKLLKEQWGYKDAAQKQGVLDQLQINKQEQQWKTLVNKRNRSQGERELMLRLEHDIRTGVIDAVGRQLEFAGIPNKGQGISIAATILSGKELTKHQQQLLSDAGNYASEYRATQLSSMKEDINRTKIGGAVAMAGAPTGEIDQGTGQQKVIGIEAGAEYSGATEILAKMRKPVDPASLPDIKDTAMQLWSHDESTTIDVIEGLVRLGYDPEDAKVVATSGSPAPERGFWHGLSQGVLEGNEKVLRAMGGLEAMMSSTPGPENPLFEYFLEQELKEREYQEWLMSRQP